MGSVLLSGGLISAVLVVLVFIYLKSLGQVDLLIRDCYVLFLSIIGGLMFIESLRAIRRKDKVVPTKRSSHRSLGQRLQFKKTASDIRAL